MKLMCLPKAVSESNLRKEDNRTPAAAFSRTDLLAILSILALLALVFRPAFAGTRGNSRAFVCLNNMRQLVGAFRTYAEDNQDKLPLNSSGGTTGNWVNGWEDFTANNPDNTNKLLLTGAKLGPYSKNVSIYKCPADIYPCLEGGRQMPRLRSVSMNVFIEGAGASTSSRWYPGWYYYDKYSDIQFPPPAKLWVFLDEHPDSINDCTLITGVTDPHTWVDLPGSLHDGGCSFGFADGHTEMKKWLDKTTLVPVLRMQINGFPAFGSDSQWVIQRSSAPRQ